MKNLNEIKDEVAKEQGYESWHEALQTLKVFGVVNYQTIADEIAKRYAEVALREAAEMIDKQEERYKEDCYYKNMILSLIKSLS